MKLCTTCWSKLLAALKCDIWCYTYQGVRKKCRVKLQGYIIMFHLKGIFVSFVPFVPSVYMKDFIQVTSLQDIFPYPHASVRPLPNIRIGASFRTTFTSCAIAFPSMYLNEYLSTPFPVRTFRSGTHSINKYIVMKIPSTGSIFRANLIFSSSSANFGATSFIVQVLS